MRLPDIFTRLHGPTKATTLRVGGVLLASILFFSARGDLSVHQLPISIFLFVTALVSAHIIVRAALHRQCGSVTATPEETTRTRVIEPRVKRSPKGQVSASCRHRYFAFKAVDRKSHTKLRWILVRLLGGHNQETPGVAGGIVSGTSGAAPASCFP